jgi:transposase
MRYSRRDVIDAIRYIAHNGCVWLAVLIDFLRPERLLPLFHRLGRPRRPVADP